jgi:hypothetical protein
MARTKPGSIMAARRAMMTMTTINSTRVKATEHPLSPGRLRNGRRLESWMAMVTGTINGEARNTKFFTQKLRCDGVLDDGRVAWRVKTDSR